MNNSRRVYREIHRGETLRRKIPELDFVTKGSQIFYKFDDLATFAEQLMIREQLLFADFEKRQRVNELKQTNPKHTLNTTNAAIYVSNFLKKEKIKLSCQSITLLVENRRSERGNQHVYGSCPFKQIGKKAMYAPEDLLNWLTNHVLPIGKKYG